METSFRTDLQQLRGFAMLLVLAVHAQLLFNGFIGVDIFFVLSGFLMGRGILNELKSNECRIDLKRFYSKRIKRLLPASYVNLCFIYITSLFILDAYSITRTEVSIFASSFFFANYYFGYSDSDYFGAGESKLPTLHYWALSLEQQFIIIWPLCIHVILKVAMFSSNIYLFPHNLSKSHYETTSLLHNDSKLKRLKQVIYFILIITILSSFLYGYYLSLYDQVWAYYSLFGRSWELLLGFLLSFYDPFDIDFPMKGQLKLVGQFIGLSLIFLGLYLIPTFRYPGLWSLFPAFGTSCFIFFGSIETNQSNNINSLSLLLIYLGDISYSVYLWHWPFIIFGNDMLKYLFFIDIDENLSYWLILLICVSGLFSLLSFYLIEKIFAKIKKSKYILIILIFPLIMALIYFSISSSYLFLSTTSRWRNSTTISSSNYNYINDPYSLCPTAECLESDELKRYISDSKYLTPPCTHGSIINHHFDDLSFSISNLTIVLTGNSHAMEFESLLSLYSETKGYRFLKLTRPGCAESLPKNPDFFLKAPVSGTETCQNNPDAIWKKILQSANIMSRILVISQTAQGQFLNKTEVSLQCLKKHKPEYICWDNIDHHFAHGYQIIYNYAEQHNLLSNLKVVYFADRPETRCILKNAGAFDINKCLINNVNSPQKCKFQFPRNNHPELSAFFADHSDFGTIFDINNCFYLINTSTVTPVLDCMPIFRDNNHLFCPLIPRFYPLIASFLDEFLRTHSYI